MFKVITWYALWFVPLIALTVKESTISCYLRILSHIYNKSGTRKEKLHPLFF